jgi:GNAT superfamily N-acetyltransferase
MREPAVDYREQKPPLADFVRLFESAGWAVARDLPRLQAAIDASWYAVCAYDGDRLAGMGRVVSDGFVHALIVDVIVAPEWQGRGVGTGVMRRLVARCQEAGIGQTQLFCARGKRSFYEDLGFGARPEDGPGMELPELW